MATSDRTKKEGEWVDSTEWHNLVAFGKTAEIVRDYVKKGSQLFIEGKITNRSWDDKQSGEKKYKTEVIVNELTLLGGKSDSPDNGNSRTQAAPAKRQESLGITDDDIPSFTEDEDPF